MSWKEFIADIVGSLAWPALVLILAFLFRAQFGRLIDRLRLVRRGSTEAIFAAAVDEGEKLAEEAKLPPASDLVEDEELTPDVLEELSHVDPRSAVISAWVLVERELAQLARRHGISARTPPRQINALFQAGVIEEPLRQLLEDLRGLRNEAAHADIFDATPEATARYIQLAERVAGELASR